jgi:hypothetical protein
MILSQNLAPVSFVQMTNTETEDDQEKKSIVTFQTANELLNRSPLVAITTTTPNKNTLFDNPLEMTLSPTEELINQGYCSHCINTKPVEKCRKITNKFNLFAHYCNVCTALFSNGTEFLIAMKSLDNFELLSLDEDELLLIRQKDHITHRKILAFKDQFNAGRS